MPADEEPGGGNGETTPGGDLPSEDVPGGDVAPGIEGSPTPSAVGGTAPAGKPERRPGRRKERSRGTDAAGNGEEPVRPSLWRTFREIIIILVIAALLAVFIQSFILKGFVIPSGSMEQTLMTGDRVFAEKITYYFRKPRRGDIIVFRYPPSDPNALNTTNPFYWPIQQVLETFHVGFKGTTPYVKRVVATEGETLELRKGKLYINGKRIYEPYIVPDTDDFGPVLVPEGNCYGFGDNRPNSRDSRFFGPIPYRSIIGKVFLVWWPFKHFGVPKGKPVPAG